MNRVAMSTRDLGDIGVLTARGISATNVAADLSGIAEFTFHSTPDGDPLMAVWSEDFGDWDVYYHE